MAAGELESLSVAIEAHRASASGAVLSEAVERVAAVEKERASAERAAKQAAAERAEAERAAKQAAAERAEAERAAVEAAAAERAAAKRAAASEKKRATKERKAAERAADESVAAERAAAESVAAEQVAEEQSRRLAAASSAAAELAQRGSARRSQQPPVGEPARREAPQGVHIGESSSSAPAASQLTSGAGRSTEPAAASAQPVMTLADVGDITGRSNVPESSLGGETTCIVCFVHPKTHLAAPCGHQCACGPCAKLMQICPYCRAPVQLWVQHRMV